jgi:hypothetical protein
VKEQIIYTVQENGMPPLEASQKIKEFHRANIGKKITTTLSNEHIRSLVQNNWLHAVIQLITDFERALAKEAGDEKYYRITTERKKLEIKEEFLGYVEVNGELKLRATHNLKTFECNELFENLQIYYAPLGLDIPSPNEKDYRITR